MERERCRDVNDSPRKGVTQREKERNVNTSVLSNYFFQVLYFIKIFIGV